MARPVLGESKVFYLRIPLEFKDEWKFFLARRPMSRTVGRAILVLISVANNEYRRNVDPALQKLLLDNFEGIMPTEAKKDDRNKRIAVKKPKLEKNLRRM